MIIVFIKFMMGMYFTFKQYEVKKKLKICTKN